MKVDPVVSPVIKVSKAIKLITGDNADTTPFTAQMAAGGQRKAKKRGTVNMAERQGAIAVNI